MATQVDAWSTAPRADGEFQHFYPPAGSNLSQNKSERGLEKKLIGQGACFLRPHYASWFTGWVCSSAIQPPPCAPGENTQTHRGLMHYDADLSSKCNWKDILQDGKSCSHFSTHAFMLKALIWSDFVMFAFKPFNAPDWTRLLPLSQVCRKTALRFSCAVPFLVWGEWFDVFSYVWGFITFNQTFKIVFSTLHRGFCFI